MVRLIVAGCLGLFCLMAEAQLWAQSPVDSLRIALESQVNQESGNWQSRLQLADIYTAQQRDDEAIRMLEQAIAIVPDSARIHLQLGGILFATKRVEAAIGAFRRTVDLAGDVLPEAYYGLSQALAESGRLPEALAPLERASQLRPTDYLYRGSYGLILHYLGRNLEACDAFDEAITINPVYQDAYRQKAQALVALGEYDQAANTLRQNLAINPLLINDRYNLGVVHILRKEESAAIEAFEVLADLDATTGELVYIEHVDSLDWQLLGEPAAIRDSETISPALLTAYAEGLKLLGIAYFTHGTGLQDIRLLARAEQILQQVKSIVPNDATVYNHIGYTYYLQSRYDAAEVEFRTALERQPGFPDAHNNLGLTLKIMERFDEAEDSYRAAIGSNAQYFAGWGNLGVLYIDQQKPEKAIDAFVKAIHIKPNYLDGYDGLASAHFMKGDLTAGVTVLERALFIDPSRAITHLQLGEAYLAQREYAAARPHFRSVFALEPRNENAYIGLGLSYLRERMLEEAILSFGMAVQVNPRSTNPRLGQAFYGIGGIYFDSGDWRQAEVFLLRSFFFDKNLPEVHFMLGDLYERTGRYSEAREAFTAEAALPRGVPQAKQRLEAIDKTLAQNEKEVAAGKFRLRHILVSTQVAADSVLADLQRGIEFVYVARTRSQDLSADRGGDTGFLENGDLVPEMEAVALALSNGEYTHAPIQSDRGYHLFQRIQ